MRWRVALAVVALAVTRAVAATYYVDAATGNDADSGLTEALAFATPRGCVLAMNGGDTCLVKNGTYVSNGSGYTPGFNFCERAISGSPGAYTTIKNFPTHTPKFCSLAGCVNGQTAGPTIGLNPSAGCGYFRFEGLEVDGSFWASGSAGAPVHHVTVTGNNFYGGNDCDGNYGPVRIEDAEFIQFDHNYVHGLQRDGCPLAVGSFNGITLFCVRDSTLEYNTIESDGPDEFTYPIIFKDSIIRDTFRYNYLKGADVGTLFMVNQNGCGASTGNAFYGNVIGGGARVGVVAASGTDIHHNTFLSGVGVENNQTTMRFRDNLVQQGGQNLAITGPNVAGPGSWSNVAGFNFDYNFYDPDAIYAPNQFATPNPCPGGCSTIGGWASALHGAGCVGCEDNSHESNVTFTSVGGVDTPYRLVCGGSPNPCVESSTNGEVGAYGVTTCVGRTCSGGVLTACNDTIDNDGDNLIDLLDTTGCVDANDTDERACGDGRIDDNEACDCGGDACLLGELASRTCQTITPPMAGGELSCHATTCQFVTTGCFEQCAPYVAALSVFDVSTQALGYEAVKAVDLHTSTPATAASTFWHNIYPGNGCTFPNCPSQPHCIDIDLNATTSVCGFQYTGRGDGACNGTFRDWQLWTCSIEACALSNDASVCGDTATPGNQWSLRASGSWPFTLATQERQFGTALSPVAYSSRYVRLRTTNSWGGGGCSSLSGDSNVGDVRFFADAGVAATPCHVLTAETASGGFTTGSNLDLALVGNCGASTGAVEVGDSATYATATKLTQVVTEWTAVNAKATGLLGAWPCDTQLYVFATPSAGSPTAAYPVVACGKLGAAVGGADVFVN